MEEEGAGVGGVVAGLVRRDVVGVEMAELLLVDELLPGPT